MKTLVPQCILCYFTIDWCLLTVHLVRRDLVFSSAHLANAAFTRFITLLVAPRACSASEILTAITLIALVQSKELNIWFRPAEFKADRSTHLLPVLLGHQGIILQPCLLGRIVLEATHEVVTTKRKGICCSCVRQVCLLRAVKLRGLVCSCLATV